MGESGRVGRVFEALHEALAVGIAKPRARVGSLTKMKNSNCRRPNHFKGFQPLHFKWQPW